MTEPENEAAAFGRENHEIRSRPGARTDDAELVQLGYRPELRRGVSQLASFASTYALLAVILNLAALFGFVYASAGPGAVWAVPVVFFGMLLVALLFAELAASYPVSGSIYQWAKRLGGTDASSWMTGWIYIAAWLIVAPAAAIAAQTILTGISPSFQLVGRGVPGVFDKSFAENAIILGIILYAFTTLVNYLSIRLVVIVGYFGLAAEMLGVLAIVVLLVVNIKRGPGVIFHNFGLGKGHACGYFGALLVAGYLPFLTFWGFDQAAQLSEETPNPRRHAPRNIIRALVLAGVLTCLIGLLAPMAVANPTDRKIGASGIAYVIVSLSTNALGKVILSIAAVAIIAAAVGAQTIASRMIFSMARDGKLIGSRALGHVDRRTQTPARAIFLVFLFEVTLLAANIGNPKIFEAVIGVGTVLAYVAYLGVVVPAVRARGTARWRPAPGSFSLGRWRVPVAVGGAIWLVVGVINFAWPRKEYYGTAWYQRYSPLIVLAAVIGLGAIHRFLVRRADESEAVAEHRPARGVQAGEVGASVHD
jgi:urea carboxylase system permease